jgi:opacity protein-like surface antigen
MKFKLLTIATLGAFLSNQAVAESLWPILETTTCSPVMTLSLGPAWTAGAETETFYLQPDIAKTYKVNRTPRSFGTGELFLGWQVPIKPSLLGQVGIAVAGGLDAPLAGNIWEDADSAFNNYTYKYKVNHGHVALKAKLLTDTNTLVQPYISGSVGAGINKSSNFSISPLIFQEVPAPLFTTGTSRALAYTLGIGIQTSYDTHWQAGVGYEFANWGHMNLGRANGQTMSTGLMSDHLYTHELQFSLTYVFLDEDTRSNARDYREYSK